jgi:hypothetical protein
MNYLVRSYENAGRTQEAILRDRDDFKKLVAQLEVQQKAAEAMKQESNK